MVLLTIVGITKTKGEVKEVQGVIAVSESSANNSDHTGAGILLTICTAFICSCLSPKSTEDRPLEGSTRKGTEEQTNLRKESRLQRSVSQRKNFS